MSRSESVDDSCHFVHCLLTNTQVFRCECTFRQERVPVHGSTRRTTPGMELTVATLLLWETRHPLEVQNLVTFTVD